MPRAHAPDGKFCNELCSCKSFTLQNGAEYLQIIPQVQLPEAPWHMQIETNDLDLVLDLFQLQLQIRVSPAQASAGISTRHMLSAAIHSGVSYVHTDV